MRQLDLCVISDLHLGTYGCHATELLRYLRSINPKTLILNGDIVDIWQFKKKYFPLEHTEVIQELRNKFQAGTEVYYITGNHDELMRRFTDMEMGNFHLVDKVVLDLDGKKYWFFHGDIFDASVNYAKWIARLGGKGYDLLIRTNRLVNLFLKKLNRPPRSFSRRIKANVKKAVKIMGDFENAAIDLALKQDYDYVVCGHIHQPMIKEMQKNGKKVIYMNSGDWVESLSALEYVHQKWSIYEYHDKSIIPVPERANEQILQKKIPIVELDETVATEYHTHQSTQEMVDHLMNKV